MYKITDKIPKTYNRYTHGEPVICLEDEYGGQAVIYVDSHCFVLSLGNDNREFKPTYHWFEEAALALKDFLIANPDFDRVGAY